VANPTTNYGFVLPTPTDLVTDLPADFDVALQGVDTRLKALQPGTTLGDLAYSSATANTNTRLAIGTTGQVLAVSAGVPAWTTISSGPTFSGCVLTNAAVQSIANATVQVVTFDTESLDTDGFHSTVTNTGRITIPAGKAGKYLFTAMGQFPNNGTGSREIAMYVNGTQKTASTGIPSGSTTTSITLAFILDLLVADYVDLRAYQSSGGALNLNGNATSTGVTNFCCTYLGV